MSKSREKLADTRGKIINDIATIIDVRIKDVAESGLIATKIYDWVIESRESTLRQRVEELEKESRYYLDSTIQNRNLLNAEEEKVKDLERQLGEALAEIDRIKGMSLFINNDRTAEISSLQSALEVARKGLQFYAYKENWTMNHDGKKIITHNITELLTIINKDFGKKAHQTLDEIGKETRG